MFELSTGVFYLFITEHLRVFFYICINYLYDKDINLWSVISISKLFFNVLVDFSCLRKHVKQNRSLVRWQSFIQLPRTDRYSRCPGTLRMFRGNKQGRERDWTVCPIWKSQRNQDVWPGENLHMHVYGGAVDRQRGHFQIFKGITHEKV